MTNVVLMAGKGQRFADAGYTIAKPLLPVSGKPMILRALECMPPADRWVFVVREDHHAQEKEVIDALRSVSNNTTILVDPNPTGQLNSCLVAKEHYDNDEPLFVGACDFGMVYNAEDYLSVMKRPGVDVVVWSFTGQPNLSRNPQAWGWLKQDAHNKVSGVSVKIPLSDDPFHDFAITGSFSFKSGKYFLELAEELMRRGIKVKNEFYIDSMLGVAIERGDNVVSFPVQYIGWGTPADYEEYLYWEKVFKNPVGSPEAAAKPEYAFWKEYFTKK